MPYHLSIHGSHDSSVCFKTSEDHFIVWELERLTKVRNYKLNTDPNFRDVILRVKGLIEKYHGITGWASCYYSELNDEQVSILKEIFQFDHMELMLHHIGHAAGAYYQSPFDECLIISSDSGGNELADGIQTFCIYHANGGQINKIANVPLDSAGAYTLLAVPISEIRKEDIWTDYLRYAGKLMGLAGYGAIRPSWIDAMREYFYLPVSIESLKQLGEKIGLPLHDINTISGQEAFDLAATGQYMFEQVSINTMLPYVKRYRLPVIHTGGSALNVLLNEKLRKELGYDIFVPCNPNDCGLAFGYMALRNPPTKRVDIRYNNFPILDIDRLPEYAEKYNASPVPIKAIARLICDGNVIGVMRGNSEVGPRALGNRSILCRASRAVKEYLNEHIKFRENFRPYGPIVLQEDAAQYFHFNGESPFMSYAPKVNDHCQLDFPAITHEDRTARLQTVTKEQNEFLYKLLIATDAISDQAVLLNTSFNSKGRPIMTTIEDAIEMWQTTELDCLLINDYLFVK